MQFIPLVTAAVSVAGQFVGMQSERRQLKEVEETNRLNETYARETARLNLNMAAQDAEQVRRKGRRKIASQIAGFAQSGFGLGGSTGMSIEDSAVDMEFDALTTMYKGELRAWDNRIQAENFKRKADAAKSSRGGLGARFALGTATSLLSGYAKYRGAIA